MSNLINRTSDGRIVQENFNRNALNEKAEMNKGKSYNARFFQYDWAAYIFLVVIVAVTVLAHPIDEQNDDGTVALQHVWYSGWLTAISTGLGIVPFLFLREPENYWLGVSNGKSG